MSRLEAITFDATGTLFTSPRLAEIYAEVLTRHGQPIDADAVRSTFRVVWQEMECRRAAGADRFSSHPGGARGWWSDFLTRLLELLDFEPPSRFAVAELFDRFASAGSWKIYKEVPDVLAGLKAKALRLAVISNWDLRLSILLARLGLAEYFDSVVVSERVGVAKPHPRIFRQTLEELGVEPTHALHVGDHPLEDVEGAIAVGMEGLLLRRQGGELADLTPLLPLVAARNG